MILKEQKTKQPNQSTTNKNKSWPWLRSGRPGLGSSRTGRDFKTALHGWAVTSSPTGSLCDALSEGMVELWLRS